MVRVIEVLSAHAALAASRGYRIPVSKRRTTVVVPLGPTEMSFACDLGEMIGASAAGMTT
jgi:hypothetical protein